MVVRVERVVQIDAPPEQVWAFIADPERRSTPISVVERFESLDENRAVWHLALPLPFTDRTVAVETTERHRDPPHAVAFTGTSKVMRVSGEHTLEAADGGTLLTNRFTVDGRVPGVESFFKRRMDAEFDNLERALNEFLELPET